MSQLTINRKRKNERILGQHKNLTFAQISEKYYKKTETFSDRLYRLSIV